MTDGAVLVTGLSGLIGGAVAHRLAATGRAVVAMDRVVPADAPFPVITHDLPDPQRWHEAIVRHRIRKVVHAGGISGPMLLQDAPARLCDINLGGLIGLLEAARIHGLERIVWFSSILAYGDRSDLAPVAEDKMQAEAQRVARYEATVQTEREKAAALLDARQSAERSAAADRHQVALMVDSRAAARNKAAGARAADLRTLKRLRAEEDRIAQQIRARAARQHGGYRGDTGGFLQRPVDGYVTSPFGWRKHPIYGYWGLHNGTDFHAPCGTPLKAAGNGTVVQRYYSDVWGNRLLIDLGKVNGANITVVYNHIDSYKVGVGSHVSRGETVAWAGTTGWSTATTSPGCTSHDTMVASVRPSPRSGSRKRSVRAMPLTTPRCRAPRARAPPSADSTPRASATGTGCRTR